MVRFLVVLLGLLILSGGAADAQQRPEEASYVASSRGRVFYSTGCDAWRSLAPANLVWFRSAAEATAAGYAPSTSAGCGVGGSAAASRSAAPAGVSPADSLCVLARVTDGDTVVCEGGRRVRLLLIDTPEMDQGPYGRHARQHLISLVPPRSILRMEFDVQREDRYRRTLAYLYAEDGRMINEELARAGYALVSVYPPNVKHLERIRAAVEAARAARAGLWDTSSAFECAPADHRRDRCE
jgi:micrococcal nuclease